MYSIKNNLTAFSYCLFFLLAFGFSNTLKAQEGSKKVVIITKKIDINGNETVERIEKEGTEAENVDIDELLKKHLGDDVKVNIESEGTLSEGTTKRVRVVKKKTIDENGEVSIDVDVQVEEGADANIEEIEDEEVIIKMKPDAKGENKWIEKDGKVIILDTDDEDVKIITKGDKTIIKKEHIIIKEGEGIDEKELEKLLKAEGIDLKELKKEGKGKKVIIKKKIKE